MFKNICSVLLIVGGINWGLWGLFSFDLVAWICGGSMTIFAKIIYTLVGLAAVGLLASCLMKRTDREQGRR